MLKESYKRENMGPPLSREEGQSHNSETGTDTDTVKQTNRHKRQRKRREQASARHHGCGGGSGGPWWKNMLISQSGNNTLE